MEMIQGFRQDESAKSPTFYAEAPTSSISFEQIEALKVLALTAEGVARLCLHSSPEAGMHIMVIAQTSGRYWRPKRHTTKSKSFNVLEGEMAVIEFAESGAAINMTLLKPEARSLMFMAPSTFHTNVAISPMCVHVEAIQGPYTPGELDRVEASFAPGEKEAGAGASYISDLIEELLRNGSRTGV